MEKIDESNGERVSAVSLALSVFADLGILFGLRLCITRVLERAIDGLQDLLQ
jgi:hypothetical protein